MNTMQLAVCIMPPRKSQKLEKRIFADKSLLLLEFIEHDLKFRTCAGKYAYYICSKCTLRVPTKCVDDGIECSIDLLGRKCEKPVVESTSPCPLQLCAICLTSECVYVCLPCMHKCACGNCAKKCRHCPICRELATSWKRIFDADIAGTADDLADHVDEESAPAVLLPITSGASVVHSHRYTHDVFALSGSSDSDSSVEYVAPPQNQHGPPQNSFRPHRQPATESEWILRTSYATLWSEAALVLRCNNRSDALILLQSMDWKLRTNALERPLARLIEMGFNELQARVCLLMHDGEENSALDELLLRRSFVAVIE